MEKRLDISRLAYMLDKETLEKKVEEVFSFIEEEGIDEFYASIPKMENAAIVRPKQRRLLMEFFELISKKYPINWEYYTNYQNKPFLLMLKNKGLITIKDEYLNRVDDDLIFDIFSEGTIGKAILNDDVEELKKCMDPFCRIPRKLLYIPSSLNFGYGDLSQIELCAYLGSEKCFKYLLLNGEKLPKNIELFAVAGRNMEIVKLLEEKGRKFENVGDVAVAFHSLELINYFNDKGYNQIFNIENVISFYCDEMFDEIAKNKNEEIEKMIVQSKHKRKPKKENPEDALKNRIADLKVQLAIHIFNSCNPGNEVPNDIGEDYDDEPKDACPFLNMAAKCGNIHVLEYITRRECDINVMSESTCPLHIACEHGFLSIAKFLVEKGAKMEQQSGLMRFTPLLWATYSGYYGIVEFLVKEGACVKCSGRNGITVLHNAARINDLKSVKLLVENGADVNAEDLYGGTPLMYATESGYVDLVKFLVDCKDIDINQRDRYGRTALALCNSKENKEIIQCLIDHGIDKTISIGKIVNSPFKSSSPANKEKKEVKPLPIPIIKGIQQTKEQDKK